MKTPADLPDTIPIFPLPGALLLPRSRLPLHVFEMRYLAMIEDCMKTPERLIGLVQTNPRKDDEEAIHSIGCAGRLIQFSETDDGRYMITLGGVSRFKVAEEIEGFTPYRRVRPNWEPFARDLGPNEDDPAFDREAFLGLLDTYFEARDLSADWESLSDADDELLINSLSMLLELEPEDKQALLEAPSLTTRRETLITLIEFDLRGGDSEEFIQ